VKIAIPTSHVVGGNSFQLAARLETHGTGQHLMRDVGVWHPAAVKLVVGVPGAYQVEESHSGQPNRS
jgi:hypothetical protein